MTVAFAQTVLSASAANDLRTGEMAVLGSETIEVFIYRPKNCTPGPLLFVFPGYERNAEGYMRRAQRIARAHCLTVFAPYLDEERFPRSRYQRAGVKRYREQTLREDCMGLFVSRLLAWGREREGRPDADYILFGHSAGAQMLSRVAAYCPLPKPVRIVIANPSAYVAPSLVEPAPYGFGGILDMQRREEKLRDYLAQPLTIYLGSEDTSDHQLDETVAANRQGSNRFQRGLAVFEDAKTLAEKRGWEFKWRLVVASGIGHSSRGMLRAPEMTVAIGLDVVADAGR